MNPVAGGATALILAGQREGAIDPLARDAGLTLKCLVPVAGRPMILHVLEAVAAVPALGRILISVNDPAAVAALPEARALIDGGRMALVPAARNLVDSVGQALAGAAFPVLVTTADNVLLTPAAITEFIAGAARADIAVAFARRNAVLAACAGGQRRFYRFSDDAYSNCNSYWIARPDALGPAEVFRGGGQFAKHPARILKAFGFINLLRFRLGIGTLEAAFARFSRRFGHRLLPVVLSDGAVAIDVDNARTLAIAATLLERRRSHAATADAALAC